MTKRDVDNVRLDAWLLTLAPDHPARVIMDLADSRRSSTDGVAIASGLALSTAAHEMMNQALAAGAYVPLPGRSRVERNKEKAARRRERGK